MRFAGIGESIKLINIESSTAENKVRRSILSIDQTFLASPVWCLVIGY
jgi:hypothetical protein